MEYHTFPLDTSSPSLSITPTWISKGDIGKISFLVSLVLLFTVCQLLESNIFYFSSRIFFEMLIVYLLFLLIGLGKQNFINLLIYCHFFLNVLLFYNKYSNSNL